MNLHDEIRYNLITKDFKKLTSLLKRPYRVYAIELPLRTPDGENYADLVLENEEENSISIVEFKSDKVDYGVCEQTQKYINITHKQTYRSKDKFKGIIIGPQFSSFEINMCKNFKIVPIVYDYKNHNLWVAR